MLDRKSAEMFYRTTAVEYLFGESAMISLAAYEFGWVVSLGDCSIHSLAVSSAKDEFSEQTLVPELHSALKELISQSLVRWEVWETSYGDGPHHYPESQSDAALFDSYWRRFFSQKKSGVDFWHDTTTLKDIFEPTIEFEGTPLLRAELLRFEIARAEPSAAPNGGPATQLGNSDITEGPPSVS